MMLSPSLVSEYRTILILSLLRISAETKGISILRCVNNSAFTIENRNHQSISTNASRGFQRRSELRDKSTRILSAGSPTLVP